MRRTLCGALALSAAFSSLVIGPSASAEPIQAVARRVEPVVLTGAQLPEWSRLSAQGLGHDHASSQGDERSAHNGQLHVPPDPRSGVAVDQIAAYSYVDGAFVEIPVQVDEKFPYFLVNPNSSFGIYSGTDEELTYEWDVESWMKTDGLCEAAYPEGVTKTEDPVLTLDDDDEVVFMASDAGAQAPAEAPGPAGTQAKRQEIRIGDPLDPTTQRFVYLFLKDSGSSFDETNGYVNYDRDDNADEYIDEHTFLNSDPELLGSSNADTYGPNLAGTVCTDDPATPEKEGLDDPETEEIEEPREVDDRFPRDGVTVSTDAYRWYASGRWMIRSMQVAKPTQDAEVEGIEYGPDLIDRWKGRAFQQSPDSTISVVGFEDEQVNWEANSALLGELQGPVRAIRETWGADSGTNVTKTETFYRDSILYRYRVRVHPIPPDGLYTSWDYNHDVADTYYNELHPEGFAIDGQNDDVGNVDEAPTGEPAFLDVNDPTFNKPLSFFNWEQVSGKDDAGSLVYMFQMNNAQSLENPLVVPYYRDDACLDDGTGDDPIARPWPGEPQTDPRVYPEGSNENCDATDPSTWANRQGAFAAHGVHYFITGDTDNNFGPKPTTEIDGQQWQWAAPTEQPGAVGDGYANTVKAPLVAVALSQANTPAPEGQRSGFTGSTSTEIRSGR